MPLLSVYPDEMRGSESRLVTLLRLLFEPLLRLLPRSEPAAPYVPVAKGKRQGGLDFKADAGAGSPATDAGYSAPDAGYSLWRDVWCLFAAAHKSDLRRVVLWTSGNVALSVLGAVLYGLILPGLQGQTFSLLTAAGVADGHADTAALRANLASLFSWICVLVTIDVSSSASQIYLGVRWRRKLTSRLHSDYLSRNASYHLAQRFPALDNPDQRITSDLDQCLRSLNGDYTTSSGGIVLSLCTNLALALAATASCVKAAGADVTLAMCGYVALVLVLNGWVNAAVPPWVRRVERAEGDLRFAHVRLRTNAEAVAFFDGSDVEARVLSDRLTAAIAAATGLYWRVTKQSLVRSLCASTDSFVILAVVAAPLFSGQKAAWTVSEITTVSNAVGLMLGGCSSLVALITPLAKVAGLARRVAELQRALAAPHAAPMQPRGPSGGSARTVIMEHTPDAIGARDLAFSTPPPAPIALSPGVTFSVRRGEALLVSGPSGVGKSSLLRCLAGLWEADAGTLLRPAAVGRGGVFFLPQRPYLPLGSLRQCIVYPRVCGAAAGEALELVELLFSLGLGHLVERFGIDGVAPDARPWDSVLSVGEQQRLGFARLLFTAPAFAILDEATSALDVEAEARCMRRCREAGFGILSVAHRPSLAEFHTHRLTMAAKGTSELTRL